jgi:hypothetical protein
VREAQAQDNLVQLRELMGTYDRIEAARLALAAQAPGCLHASVDPYGACSDCGAIPKPTAPTRGARG